MAPWLALINTAPKDVMNLSVELDGASLFTEDFAKKLQSSGRSADGLKEALAMLGVSGEDFDVTLKTSGGSAEQFAENLLEACDSGTNIVSFRRPSLFMGFTIPRSTPVSEMERRKA